MGYLQENLQNYQEYLSTKHWKNLKQKLIYNDKRTCFICNSKSKLVIHHIDYSRLFKEKLYKDVYILCFSCHEKVHYWTTFRFKLPLIPTVLVLSIYIRKILFYTQNRQFILFLLYLFITVLISLFAIIIYLLKNLTYFLLWLIFQFINLIMIILKH